MRLWSGFAPAAAIAGLTETSTPFSQLVSFQLDWSGFFTVSLEFGVDRLSLWMV
jgi:hypothetical protein